MTSLFLLPPLSPPREGKGGEEGRGRGKNLIVR